MKIFRHNGSTSNVIRGTLRNSTTGQGLTGLTSASTGLIISTIADNEPTATNYTVAGSTIQTITTLGTFAAPSASNCRFKEVDATNQPGLYEFQFADARFAVSSAKSLEITISGATSLLSKTITVQQTATDIADDAVHGGMSAIPNTACTTNASLLTSGNGTDQIANSAGKVLLQATQSGVTIPTVTTLTNAPSDSSGVTTLLTRISGTITITSGGVLVHSIDTGGITAASFAAAAITSTVAPNLDAAVSSRMATFTLPTNFSSLGITAGGHITTVDTLTNAPSDSSGVTTLLGRIGGAITITSGGVLVHSVDTGGIAAASFAAAAITATVAPNLDAAVSSRAAQTTADSISSALTGANSEPASVPAANASIVSKIAWLFQLGRNKRTQTSTTETVLADDNSTSVSTATKSDDGTTFVRGKYS